MGVYTYRLLYTLAQSLEDGQKDLFPEYGFDIQAIFTYLNISNNKRRYEILNSALKDLGENMLSVKTYTRNGAIRWVGTPWITKYDFAMDENLLNIQINENVKWFLLKLKKDASIRTRNYLNLSTEYQNWFYPYLKKVTKLGKWRVAIEDLKRALFLENRATYDVKQNKNANEHFLKWVIGIRISKNAKLENQTAAKAKRKPKLIEWDYTKNKEDNFTGTLYGITSGTDINVTASIEKTGRLYTHIVFFLSEKRKNTGVQTGNKLKFPNIPKNVTTAKVQYYTPEQVYANAKSMNLPIAVFLEKMKLKQTENGHYYKTL